MAARAGELHWIADQRPPGVESAFLALWERLRGEKILPPICPASFAAWQSSLMLVAWEEAELLLLLARK
jgi:hypothetical protein